MMIDLNIVHKIQIEICIFFLFRHTSPQPFHIPMYAMYDITFQTGCMDYENQFLYGQNRRYRIGFQSEVGCHISFSIYSVDKFYASLTVIDIFITEDLCNI